MSRHSTFAVPLRDRSHRSRSHFVCLPTGTTLSQIITYVIAQRHGVELTAICPYHTSALVCTLDAPRVTCGRPQLSSRVHPRRMQGRALGYTRNEQEV